MLLARLPATLQATSTKASRWGRRYYKGQIEVCTSSKRALARKHCINSSAKAAIRQMVDFHHSSTARPSTEEALLSMYADDHDVRDAEFIRTYQSIDFPGYKLLQRQEVEAKVKESTTTRLRAIPASSKSDNQKPSDLQLGKCFDDVYGFRPNDEQCFLS